MAGTCVPVSRMILGPIETNVYVFDDGVGCFVVDPACDVDLILREVGDRKLDAIIVTHAHWDHTGGLRELREATGAKVIASAVETPYINGEKSFSAHAFQGDPCPVDWQVEDGDTIEIGKVSLRVIATPGHTPGGMCLFIEPTDQWPGSPVLISGDTLFAGTHGRVDFEEGDSRAMGRSLAKLAELPEETVVLPGHNAATSIAREVGWLRRLS